MKMYELSLALVLFNCVLSIISLPTLGIFPINPYSPDAQAGFNSGPNMIGYADKLNKTVGNYNNPQMNPVNELYLSIQLLISSLPMVFEILIYSTVGFPLLLTGLGVPGSVVTILAIPIYFIFVFGILEIMTGKAFD